MPDFLKFARALLCLLLLLPATGVAQRYAGAQCEDPSRGLLWRVESAAPGGNNIELYLLGSIHVGMPDFYPLPTRIEALYRAADYLVFEVDQEQASDPRIAMQMQLRGMLPRGQTLDSVVSASTMQNLEAVMQDMGLPLANFMNFKPWMIALLLTNMQSASLGYDPAYGLESYLLRNRAAHTRILELESIEAQLDLLESLDPESFLDYTLQEFANSAELMNQMVAAWLCGDQLELTDILFATEAALADAAQTDEGINEVFELLFARRNVVMADGIENYLRSGAGSYLVVVGSGHLLGEGSVVELLQQRGHRVSPVSPRP